ncbi:MAG: carbohydrate-binding family 9-like protein [Acidobacteriia bacterium]|nr:carbohydrate-binding family 9-like protein [Terriglobia bacterium]
MVTSFLYRFLLSSAAMPLLAQSLPRHDILRAPAPIVIDGKLDETAWRQAPAASDFHFNWWKEGPKEQTVAKLLWDDENLYVGFYCHDKNISGQVVQRHGPVSRDDCVEAFISPNASKPRNYYGFEINVLGTMLNFIRADWYKGPFNTEPEGVRYRTSFHGLPVKNESPEDDHWILELAIPFKNFVKDAPNTPPRDGDAWRLNLNRAGGRTNAQYSTWSPVSAEKPNFHVPEAFGSVRFVNRPPP